MKTQVILLATITLLLISLLFVPIKETEIIVGIVFLAVVLATVYIWVSKKS